jgi:hypothetical protein
MPESHIFLPLVFNAGDDLWMGFGDAAELSFPVAVHDDPLATPEVTIRKP